MPGIIEDYAKARRKIHPDVLILLTPFFEEYNWSPERAKVKIIGPWWGSLAGRRGGATAAFVIGRTINMMRGALHSPTLVRGNSFDLSTPVGFATFAHEVLHTYQNDTINIFKRAGDFFGGIFKSIFRSKILYDHKFFEMELQAIEFQRKVYKIIKASEQLTAELKKLEALR